MGYMSQHEINSFYVLVEQLSTAHGRTPQEVKLLVSTFGEAHARAHLERKNMESGSNSRSNRFGRDCAPTARQAALQVLGFRGNGPEPTSAEITRQFRQLAKVWHPDKRHGASHAAASPDAIHLPVPTAAAEDCAS